MKFEVDAKIRAITESDGTTGFGFNIIRDGQAVAALVFATELHAELARNAIGPVIRRLIAFRRI